MPDTAIFSIQSPDAQIEEIQQVAKILKQGGLAAIPTETVYGLAANALNPQAVERIFRAKGRPQDNPLIVHIADVSQAARYARDIPSVYYTLCERFAPGPLTIILHKQDCIPDVTSGGLNSVALRIPAHPVARAIIREAELPIAAPSANLSGKPSPTTAQHCMEDLLGKVDAIVDAGPCQVGVESTVISLVEEKPVLLRPGAVTAEQLREVLGELLIHPAVTAKLQEGSQAISPGMKYKHYAPKAKVTVLNGTSQQYTAYVNAHAGPGVYALCFDEDIARLQVPHVSWGSDDASQAHRLFAALRELDKQGAVQVYAHCPRKQGVGLAVYNRLIRAAGFDECDLREQAGIKIES